MLRVLDFASATPYSLTFHVMYIYFFFGKVMHILCNNNHINHSKINQFIDYTEKNSFRNKLKVQNILSF